jgi:hypothetical protein
VDGLVAGFGFVEPAWYARFKADVEPEVGDPGRLAALARGAGFRSVEVTTHPVDVGVSTPPDLTAWRLGMAHLAPFVAALDPAQRQELRAQCEQTLAGAPPLVVPLIVLAASTAA